MSKCIINYLILRSKRCTTVYWNKKNTYHFNRNKKKTYNVKYVY